jgi:hypothetical protein
VRHFSDFHVDFSLQLEAALSTSPDYGLAAPWREATAWVNIARATACVYTSAIQAAGSELRNMKENTSLVSTDEGSAEEREHGMKNPHLRGG